jgi:chromosome segregation ATPase
LKKKLSKKLDRFHKKKSKLIVIVLISVIVLLTLALSYDMYTLFKTKANAEATQSALNENIIFLTQERDQLLVERNNLIEELEHLNQTVINLNNQKNQLIAESNSLTSDLEELQNKYDSLSEELEETESELATCLSS